ncbi:MAG: hypothetical protein DRQ02_10795 [Candidatus Latescibacterota bacterium]|nr:MAG: hypothetical protein DRQ02_10795 [Candidatus Latescibacterota bacterium]
MPEVPDLEVIEKVPNQRIRGLQVERLQILQPIVIRYPSLEQLTQISKERPFYRSVGGGDS